jgi:hypothetical protein
MDLLRVGLQDGLQRSQTLQQSGGTRDPTTCTGEPQQNGDVLAAQQESACIALDLGPVRSIGFRRELAVLHIRLGLQACSQHGELAVVFQAFSAGKGLAHRLQQFGGHTQGGRIGIRSRTGERAQQLLDGIHAP